MKGSFDVLVGAGVHSKPHPLKEGGYSTIRQHGPTAWSAAAEIVYFPAQRLKISAALVPPKPNEFESAYSTSTLRATLGT